MIITIITPDQTLFLDAPILVEDHHQPVFCEKLGPAGNEVGLHSLLTSPESIWNTNKWAKKKILYDETTVYTFPGDYYSLSPSFNAFTSFNVLIDQVSLSSLIIILNGSSTREAFVCSLINDHWSLLSTHWAFILSYSFKPRVFHPGVPMYVLTAQSANRQWHKSLTGEGALCIWPAVHLKYHHHHHHHKFFFSSLITFFRRLMARSTIESLYLSEIT